MIQKKKPKHTLQERGIYVRPSVMSDDEFDASMNKASEYFYNSIWQERDHICFETGERLTEEPLSLYFHHILPKAKYPLYEHAKWNIVLLHPDTHSQVETFIDKCPRVKALTEHLKIVYG